MFEEVYVISLARRKDRLERFFADLPKDWPFKQPIVFEAVDGKECPHPSWWKQGGGAWGCYRSHMAILESCIQRGVESVLILEDDALCLSDFTEQWQEVSESVPADWDMLYLGGQHLGSRKPEQINEHILIPHNVNRTHAYAVKGLPFMRQLYKYLFEFKEWGRGEHIDHRLGKLHEKRKSHIYTTIPWLIGQNDASSDVQPAKQFGNRFWVAPNDVTIPEDEFVAVVGLHRSGSSCMAGVLHHLGVHMGQKFVGCEPDGGYEAATLAQKLEQAMRFPTMKMRWTTQQFAKTIRPWLMERCDQAAREQTIAGGKYPHLCAYAQSLKSIFHGRLKVVHINRPLQESIDSLILREGKRHKPQVLADLQTFLWEEKQKFLACTPHITVEYADLLQQPETEVRKVAEYLQLELQQGAIDYIDPKKRKIGIYKP